MKCFINKTYASHALAVVRILQLLLGFDSLDFHIFTEHTAEPC